MVHMFGCALQHAWCKFQSVNLSAIFVIKMKKKYATSAATFAVGALSAAVSGTNSNCQQSRKEPTTPYVHSPVNSPSCLYLDHSSISRSDLLSKILRNNDFDKHPLIVIDNFINRKEVERVRAELLTHEFCSTQQGADIRNDEVFWIDSHTIARVYSNSNSNSNSSKCSSNSGNSSNSSSSSSYSNDNVGIVSVISQMKELQNVFLDQSQNSLIFPKHIQAALYRGNGSFYTKHRDNKLQKNMNIDDDALWMASKEQRMRYMTCIIYLTEPEPKWNADDDGGALRCYLHCDNELPSAPSGFAIVNEVDSNRNNHNNHDCGDSDDDNSAREIVDIEPKSGRLIIFRSQQVLHEVMPTYRSRLAVTAWMLFKQEGL